MAATILKNSRGNNNNRNNKWRVGVIISGNSCKAPSERVERRQCMQLLLAPTYQTQHHHSCQLSAFVYRKPPLTIVAGGLQLPAPKSLPFSAPLFAVDFLCTCCSESFVLHALRLCGSVYSRTFIAFMILQIRKFRLVSCLGWSQTL